MQVYFCFFFFFLIMFNLIYVSVPLPVWHCLLYRNAVISFKIYWKFKLIPPILLSFFQNWVTLVPLPFSINFQIILFMPTKKAYGDFDRNWSKSLYHSGENWHLYTSAMASLPNHEHNLSLYFFRFSLSFSSVFCSVQHIGPGYALLILHLSISVFWVLINGIAF